ncbi:MAG: single-stranded DNA-binding protein [Fibrobacter sp.]|nr:single-stranded DNA-binding protein [Fibrobacter sp.]
MAYLNKVMLIGNIGKDVEIKASSNGRKFASFSLATSKHWTDCNGKKMEQTTWHNVVAWGKLADTFERICVKKGTAIYVEGSLSNSSYERNGVKCTTTSVVVDTFQLLTPRDDNKNRQERSYNLQPEWIAPKQQADEIFDDENPDNELPF